MTITNAHFTVVTAKQTYSDNDDNSLYINFTLKSGKLLLPGDGTRVKEKLTTGDTDTFDINLRRAHVEFEEIADVVIRKPGKDAWIMKSFKVVFDNDLTQVIECKNVYHMFTDTGVILRPYCLEWKSSNIYGPIVGSVRKKQAAVWFKADRIGKYKLSVGLPKSKNRIEREINIENMPFHTEVFQDLQPDTRYIVELRSEFSNETIFTYFTTAPSSVNFQSMSFYAVSCQRNLMDYLNDRISPWQRMYEDMEAKGAEFCIHLGDSHYLFDDFTYKKVGWEPIDESEEFRMGSMASRQDLGYQKYGRHIPLVPIWDDHDFGGNNSYYAPEKVSKNSDSKSRTFPVRDRSLALKEWQRCWPTSAALDSEKYGLTSFFSYGNVDFYLMDGRYNRQKGKHIFTKAQITRVLFKISSRAKGEPNVEQNEQDEIPEVEVGKKRFVVIVTGSCWHSLTKDKPDSFAHKDYKEERKLFFDGLSELHKEEAFGSLLLISGGEHVNRIYQISLDGKQGVQSPHVIELMCSPLSTSRPQDDTIINKDVTSDSIRLDESRVCDSKILGFSKVKINSGALNPEEWTVELEWHDINGKIYKRKFSVSNRCLCLDKSTDLDTDEID